MTGMFSEIHLNMATNTTTEEHYVRRIKNVSCEIEDFVKSHQSIARCVGYFDRAYYGFYVIS